MDPPRRDIGSTALDELRQRLRDMNDAELIRFGRACSQQVTGEPPYFGLVELEEAQDEWRRRHERSLAQI
jgi:hypothetical protein